MLDKVANICNFIINTINTTPKDKDVVREVRNFFGEDSKEKSRPESKEKPRPEGNGIGNTAKQSRDKNKGR